jgi:hypothetical protein
MNLIRTARRFAELLGLASPAQGGTGLDGSAAGPGQLLIGNGAGFTLAGLSAGDNITVTPGAGSIVIAASGGGDVTSVFGRAGVVVARAGDYDAAQITGLGTAATRAATDFQPAGSYLSPTGDGSGLTGLTGSQVAGNIAGDAASITGSITEGQVDGLVSDLASKAPTASPTFTGTVNVSIINASGSTSGYIVSRRDTTAPAFTFLSNAGELTVGNEVTGHAPMIVDPSSDVVAFLASPTGPTPTAGDNSTKLATTAFVLANGGGGSSPTSTNNQVTLGSSFTITAPLGQYQSTGLSITLPAVGTYLITGNVRIGFTVAGGNGWISILLFDNLTSSAIANSTRLTFYDNTGSGVDWQMMTGFSWLLTTTVANTPVLLYAGINGAGTFSVASILSDFAGQTSLAYVRLA